MLQTLVVNWDYVGGSRGAYIIRPERGAILGSYIQYLFLIMILLAVVALTVARLIERSRLGYGFATIRDDELAAEACGVPTLRLKLIATTLSGALMGMAGAPFPYYIGYLEPGTAFGLSYGVNSIAMPMIGGTTSWVGPLIGALIVATLQQWCDGDHFVRGGVLIVGLLLIGFVIIAPNGLVGLVQAMRRRGDTAHPGAGGCGLPDRRQKWPGSDDGRTIAPGRKRGQTLRRIRRARRHQLDRRARRARRADRTQRFGQEHAGQLPVRHAVQ